RPRTRFNRGGYLLHDVLTEDQIDLARLLVGSEGTLGVFTEATLRPIPLPGGQAVALPGFSSLAAALRASQRAAATGPGACDLLVRRLVALSRGGVPSRRAAAEAVLLVEYEADSPAEARDMSLALVDQLQRIGRLALRASVAAEPDEIEQLCCVRDAALPGLYGLRGGARALPFIEDVAVPPESLAAYLDGLQRILQQP